MEHALHQTCVSVTRATFGIWKKLNAHHFAVVIVTTVNALLQKNVNVTMDLIIIQPIAYAFRTVMMHACMVSASQQINVNVILDFNLLMHHTVFVNHFVSFHVKMQNVSNQMFANVTMDTPFLMETSHMNAIVGFIVWKSMVFVIVWMKHNVLVPNEFVTTSHRFAPTATAGMACV